MGDISSRLKISVQNKKNSKPQKISVQFQTNFKIQFQFYIKFNFKSKYISISFQYPKFLFKNFSIHFKNQTKMSENIELSYLWEHTITKIFKHDSKSELGLMFKQ